MNFTLKEYQEEVLTSISEFFQKAKMSGDIAAAYDAITKRKQDSDEISAREKSRLRYSRPYHFQEGLESCPHVCMRIPTAGGKTYMAAKSIKFAADYMETQTPTILWLAPTTAIAEQTLEALQNCDHPCRAILEESFNKNSMSFQVIGVEDFKTLQPGDFTDKVCIIVATYAMFRVTETADGREKMTADVRRVYAGNEDFESHFEHFLPNQRPPDLEKDREDNIVYSFVNLLHLVRPLVVLDEAHNFLTELSKKVLQRINPACILEWTATPRNRSNGEALHNVLISIDAESLQKEEMIKLPFIVGEHNGWQETVAEAVSERAGLAAIAKESDEVIRPIVLYQAQDRNGDVPPSVLKQHLITRENISEDKIAIATGDIKELEGVDLLAADCQIEHIITKDALREGWDCPYAYVLCGVAKINSSVAIEQLLGRIMRMPFAKRRKREELNYAYVHAPKDNQAIGESAKAVGDRLRALGFEEDEIKDQVQPKLPGKWEDDLFVVAEKPIFIIEEKPDFSNLSKEEYDETKHSVVVNSSSDGGFEITIRKPISPAVIEKIVDVTAPPYRETTRERLRNESVRLKQEAAPATQGEKFMPLPQFLFYSSEEEREVVATPSSLHAIAKWNNIGDNCLLGDFNDTDTAEFFRVFVESGKVRTEHEIAPLSLFRESTLASVEHLTAWLAEEIRYKDGRYFTITLKELAKRNVEHLIKEGRSLVELSRAKYLLAVALKNWLELHSLKVFKSSVQKYIFDNKDLRCDYSFVFPPRGYSAGPNPYNNSFKFKRHYYGVIGKISPGEEMQCAMALDRAEHIRYWIRNMDRQINSYALPLPNGYNFYPDFIAQLDDGYVLIVEYKGQHISDETGTVLKREMGQHLEKMSDGKCFFLMPSIKKGEPSLKEQIAAKIREIKANA